MAKKRSSYFLNGTWYIHESELVETDYGPENRVSVWPENQKHRMVTMQEPAGTETIVCWAIIIITQEAVA